MKFLINDDDLEHWKLLLEQVNKNNPHINLDFIISQIKDILE